ncbi:MAG: Rieske 2Fe-2S domain-containing protein [Rhodothermales bacterium]|nr:Rieske 2Fe-2S domain-containing protein [Rhodothermales bacterium]MBO6780035.1 Rieske 2Fe-2S domain-containing protein [Rhodothermales bacterium]
MASPEWQRVLGPDELPDGRVKSVSCGLRTLCMTRFNGRYGALDNRCPHQGGPLGEGSIENGLLRCPWHGWDYDPISGKAPGFDDGVETYPVEERADGVYVQLPPEPEHERTVSDVMAETLVNWGISACWGMVGHSNLGLADALRRQEASGKLRFVGIRHEGAAAFAASAYGKLTGRPAACFAIAGPGATNLITGLWDAHVDRSPVIALTGQVDTQVLGPGAFQEVDLQAAYGGVAQWSQSVLPGSRHAELVNLAARTAILNRGVSHLIFPDEVQNIPAPTAEAGSPHGRLPDRDIAPPEEGFQRAAEALAAARRPVIIVGHGARYDMEAVTELAEKLRCPVLTTFKGKGLISDHHPLGCGVLGRSGTPIASYFMNEADLLLVFGASFSNHTGITSKIPTIQVDFDPLALARFHAIDHPLMGAIGRTARMFADALTQPAAQDQSHEIRERWAIWRAEKERRVGEDSGDGISSASLFQALNRHIDPDAVIAVDVGNNTYSFGRYFEATSQAVLMSGYLGSIGYALPAAMGAWAATQEPDTTWHGRQVVSISGDGGLGQYLAELTTLVQYHMNITHVVLNNSELGKISKEQRAGSWDVWKTGLSNPSFARFARQCGAMGVEVKEDGQLDAMLKAALDHKGPALVEVHTDALLV